MPNDTRAATDHHAALHGGFRWHVPADFNIAWACCGRWAAKPEHARRVAVAWEHADGRRGTLSYAQLWSQARRLAAALQRHGVLPGQVVAVLMAQRPEAAVAHVALQLLGAVAMPLSVLFGPEALAFRLQDGQAVLALVDELAMDNILQVRAACPELRSVVAVGGAAGQGDIDWADLLGAPAGRFRAAQTAADAAALLIYTSGTTGPPKGALMPQRALIGNLSGFVCSQNWFSGAQDEVFWSPADWAWTGGLMDALLPTLYFGGRIVAYQGRFTPEVAFGLMERHRVTHSFLFPTALKAMMKALPLPQQHYKLHLQSVMSAGEALGDAVFGWCQQALGLTVNEMFGQTEINYVVGNCGRFADASGHNHPGWPARPGSMGRAYPGHRVAVIDDAGQECPRGTPGDVAVHRLDAHGQPDPVFFLGYWKQPQATAAKFTGSATDSWCRTGDTAVMDADGYLWYQGRSDDVFKSSGYRIGPSEIENCLVKHPAVANAAVVPRPDAERGAVVKAFVVLAAGAVGDAALVAALQQHVRGQLAPYEYPKEIEFVDSLPMTTTGKLQRRVLRLQEEEKARQGVAEVSNCPPASPSG